MSVILYSTHKEIIRRANKRTTLTVLVLFIILFFGMAFLAVTRSQMRENLDEMKEKYSVAQYQMSRAAAREALLSILRAKPMTVGQALAIVDVILSQKDVPIPLILGIMSQESQFSPWAQSDKGAVGIMQVMPTTFQIYIINPVLGKMPMDPALNVKAAIAYLSDMSNIYKDWKKVLRVYCGGPDHVNNKSLDPYVNAVLADAKKYGLEI